MSIQPSASQPPSGPPLSALALGFELGLGRWEANKTIQENPETVLLEHQYHPEVYSMCPENSHLPPGPRLPL